MMDQPMYTPCAEWAEKLAATHLYDLSPSDRAALDMHIASCPACATVRAEYQAIDALILDSSGVEPLPDLPIRLLHPRKMLVRLNGSFAPVPMSSLAALTVGETASDEVDREVSLPALPEQDSLQSFFAGEGDIKLTSPIPPERSFSQTQSPVENAVDMELSSPVPALSGLPGMMSLSELADHCMSEINNYRHGEASNDEYCLEIFRRAMLERDDSAWALLVERFNEYMLGLFRRHRAREAASRIDSPENYVAKAFERFWLAAVHNRRLEFTTLAAALSYLRNCLNGAILDTLRAHSRSRDVALPEPDFAEEPAMEDHDLAFRHRKQNYPRENFCDMDKCPTCGAGVRPGDNFCLTCGNRLFPVASFPQQSSSTIDDTTVPAQDWSAPNAPAPVYAGWSDVSDKTIPATVSSSELPTVRADASVIAAQPMPEKIEHPAHFVIRAPNGDILQDYLLEKPEVVIGRVVECDINFPNDMLVSRKHATVHYEDSYYVLRDQGSANGTLVNNQQLVSMTNWTLQDGDTILIGDHELTFKASTPMVSGSDQIRWKTASLYFRQVSFLADLPDEDIRALMAVARKRTFRAGEIIFHRDDVGQVLYVIKEGKVNICRISPEGQEISLVVLGKGDCFGELAILDGLPRSADAIALERVECYTLQRSDFYNAIMKNPKIATQVLEVLSRRLRKTDDLVEDLVVLDVYGHVAKKLLDLAHEHGVEVENGIRIDIRLTQQDLASMVGASRESVNKVLVYFTDKGYISSDKHKIALHRIEELKRRIY